MTDIIDHESIWLQPKCCASPGEDRLWCEDPLVECDVCGAPAIRFIRADIADALRSERDRLHSMLIAEREDNLWNAYHTGHVREGRWTHMFMSDGEWLARCCGFDPKLADYDDQEIRAAIPKAAEAMIATALSPACPEAPPASTSRSTSAGKGASE